MMDSYTYTYMYKIDLGFVCLLGYSSVFVSNIKGLPIDGHFCSLGYGL